MLNMTIWYLYAALFQTYFKSVQKMILRHVFIMFISEIGLANYHYWQLYSIRNAKCFSREMPHVGQNENILEI